MGHLARKPKMATRADRRLGMHLGVNFGVHFGIDFWNRFGIDFDGHFGVNFWGTFWMSNFDFILGLAL